MIPLTNKETEPIKHHDPVLYRIVKRISLYGVISSLLLPLTVRGPIGGQYGVLLWINTEGEGLKEMISLTDVPFAVEVFLTILFFLANLIGYISVVKMSKGGMIFYMSVRGAETYASFIFFKSVSHEYLKSHIIPQSVLAWCWFIASMIELMSVIFIAMFAFDDIEKYKNI